jgi:drug/metabolite transporter (DMT)-like permease
MVQWYFLILGSIVFTTIGALIEKKTLYKEHAMEFSTVFYVLLSLFSLILIPFLDFGFPTYYILIIYGLSWINALGFLFIAKGTRHMQISSSSPLMAFGPMIVAVLAFLFLKETLAIHQIGGIALVLLGSYILKLRKRKSIKEELLTPFKIILKSKYVHFILFAMFLYAISSVVSRFLINTENPAAMNPLSFVFLLYIFITINLTILIATYHDGLKGIKKGLKSAGKWISIMAVVMLLGRLLMVYAITMPTGKIALIVALRRSGTVLTTFFGGEIFKDRRVKQKTLASLVMVLGAIILAL